MECSENPFPAVRPPAAPSPPAVRLAAALAERLDAVLPRPFTVRGEGAWVTLYRGAARDSSSDVAAMLDQLPAPEVESEPPEERPFVERVRSIAWSVLGSVQDSVAEATAEPWPALPQRGMALPGKRADGDRVYLWYGPDHAHEAGAVLRFPPIPLGELAGSG